MTNEEKNIDFYVNQFKNFKFNFLAFKKIRIYVNRNFIIEEQNIHKSLKLKNPNSFGKKIEEIEFQFFKYQKMIEKNQKGYITKKIVRILFLIITSFFLIFTYIGFVYFFIFFIATLISYTFYVLFFTNNKKFKNIVFSGIGIKVIPIIFVNVIENKGEVILKKSNLFILIRNCIFDNMRIKDCENILIENSSFNNLTIEKCSKFRIIKCRINEKLYLYQSDDNFFNDTDINILDIDLSTKNQILNCKIKRIQNNFSINNNFVKIKTSKIELNNLHKPIHYNLRNLLVPLVFLLPIFFFILIILYVNGMLLFLSLSVSFLVTFFVFIILHLLFFEFYTRELYKKKISQLPDNKIID